MCEALASLAREKGRTVVLTVHQPSAKVFSLFDKVLFLAAGKVTYFGSSKNLSSYTARMYEAAELGDAVVANPPEMFLELCDTLAEQGRLELLFDERFARGETSQQLCQDAELAALEMEDGNMEGIKAQAEYRNTMSALASNSFSTGIAIADVSYAHCFWDETRILMRRATTNMLRTPETFQARLMASVIFGTLMGTLFYDTQNDANGVSQRASYFIFSIANFYYTSLDALQIILSEREIFQREYSR